MKNSIEIKEERVPYFDGLSLYVDGKKVHPGVFVSLKALRDFWREKRSGFCNAGRYEFKNPLTEAEKRKPE